MKKFLILVIMTAFTSCTVLADNIDKYSKEYLQTHSGFLFTKSIAEFTANQAIKKALKQSTGTNFDVKLEGYSMGSIKKGIFKYLELSANDVLINNIKLSYLHLQSLSDYNYIDYTKNPMEFLSDMVYAYEIKLNNDAINEAVKNSKYSKTLQKVNNIASPFFNVCAVSTKIENNKLYIITEYNLPLAKTSKNRNFVAASDFQVVNGKIKAKNISINSAYGKIGLDKVANLINYLNPLEFTMELLDKNMHKTNIENINIVDNEVIVSGKIMVKGKGAGK